MKKIIAVVAIMLMAATTFALPSTDPLPATEEARMAQVVIAPDILGMILLGNIGLGTNIRLSDNFALDTGLAYLNIRNSLLLGALVPEGAELQAFFGKIGASYYFKETFNGFYGAAYFNGGAFNFQTGTSDSDPRLSSVFLGIGARLGWAIVANWISFRVYCGFEYNASLNETSTYTSSFAVDALKSVNGGQPTFGLELGIAIY
jgi:hypothetical protein